MITVRRSAERGHFDHGWLDTYHTFSFADYLDARHMNFHSLRVINEDRVKPGEGFPTHSHREMEIVTYVLEGALQHKDSTGGGSIIRPGEVQRMSAGTGIAHSEFNPSGEKELHLLQIWITPGEPRLRPSYEQTVFPAEQKHNRLCLVGSRDGRNGSLTIHQDVDLYACVLDSGISIEFDLRSGRHGWVQVARGAVTLNGHRLEQGDGAAISGERRLDIVGEKQAELLVFDLGAEP